LEFHSGREADHSPLSSAEVKEWMELYLHSPNTPSWRGAQGSKGTTLLYFYTTRGTSASCPFYKFCCSVGCVKLGYVILCYVMLC
jgi:hypothetical protein